MWILCNNKYINKYFISQVIMNLLVRFSLHLCSYEIIKFKRLQLIYRAEKDLPSIKLETIKKLKLLGFQY